MLDLPLDTSYLLSKQNKVFSIKDLIGYNFYEDIDEWNTLCKKL